MKVKINLLKFLHISLNPHGIPQILKCKSESKWSLPALELFLSKVNKDIFLILFAHPNKFNLNKNEYLTMRILQNDRSVIIKPPDKKD